MRILGQQDNPPVFANGRVAAVPSDVSTEQIPTRVSESTSKIKNTNKTNTTQSKNANANNINNINNNTNHKGEDVGDTNFYDSFFDDETSGHASKIRRNDGNDKVQVKGEAWPRKQDRRTSSVFA